MRIMVIFVQNFSTPFESTESNYLLLQVYHKTASRTSVLVIKFVFIA